MIDKPKKYLIETFLKITKQDILMKKVLDETFTFIRNIYIDVSNEEYNDVKKQYNMNEYISRVISVIDKHFTKEELKELIQFFSSSIGKKFISSSLGSEINRIGRELYDDIEMDLDLIIASKHN
jgi:hypothetical protein